MSECPVCRGVLPASKPRGRPREYCSKVCSERARSRRRQAARLLEYADNVEAHVGNPAFGSEAYLRSRAAILRADAAELLESIGEASSGFSGRKTKPVSVAEAPSGSGKTFHFPRHRPPRGGS
jgi:hypothetical protein